MKFELFLSWRYLRSKSKQAFFGNRIISISGVAVGVMALIVVISVMSGFERELKAKVLGTFSHLTVYEASGNMGDSGGVLDKILDIDGITAGSPFISGQALLRTSSRAFGVNIRGIDPETEQDVANIGKYIVRGRLDFGEDGIIVGEELAKKIGLRVGDIIRIISPAQVQTPSGPVQIVVESEVAGLFDSGMYEYDVSLAYVSLDTARRLFRLGDGVTGLSLVTRDLDGARELKGRISDLLGPRYRVMSWMDLNPNLFAAVRMEKKVMFFILTLIILVAALNIISTLTMMVMEKTKDIGILKAIGSSSKSIMVIFTMEGLIIGVIGAGFGVLLGLLFAGNINSIADFVGDLTGFQLFSSDVYYFDRIPADIYLSDIVIISVCAVVISVFAALYPAWHAARLNPVEALRYE